jgi:surfactin synthase thioesterase subunit
MVTALTEVLVAEPDIPLVLYGHSLGSLLAFETARMLESRDRAVLGLIVSGRRSPTVRPPQGVEMGVTDDDGIVDAMRRMGGIDSSLLHDPDVLELILPALRADFRLAASYAPESGSVISCPITVLNGHADPSVSKADSESWRAHTARDCVTYEVSGGHFFFNTDRSAFLRLLSSALAGYAPAARLNPGSGQGR